MHTLDCLRWAMGLDSSGMARIGRSQEMRSGIIMSLGRCLLWKRLKKRRPISRMLFDCMYLVIHRIGVVLLFADDKLEFVGNLDFWSPGSLCMCGLGSVLLKCCIIRALFLGLLRLLARIKDGFLMQKTTAFYYFPSREWPRFWVEYCGYFSRAHQTDCH